jgi:flagellar biosynthetic protein FlhB
MADKSEAPTPRKLEEAREKGQIVRSVELNVAASMLVAAMLLGGPGKDIALAMRDLLLGTIAEIPHVDITQRWLETMGINYAIRLAPSFAFLLIGLLLIGVAVTLVQTNFLWTHKGFDFSRLNPLSGLKRIFSSHGLVEMLKSLLKLALIGWVSYSYINGRITEMVGLVQMDLNSAIGKFLELAVGLAMQIGQTYLVLAVADYAYQRWNLMRDLRMTKEEIKEEYKRSEGDPLLKSRIRSEMRRMARSRMMSAVPKSTVVVTNPTHLAVAIQYENGMHAPMLMAKGAHLTAQRIVKIARENNIPVVQNIPVARAIYKTIEIGQEISPDLYTTMAEILAYVFRLQHRPQHAPQGSL